MKIKILLTLGILFSFLNANCMERPSRLEQPLHTDKRKIGILSWGSIIRDPRGLKIKGSFEKSTLKLPIELFRLSGKGKSTQRITRIIDKDAGVPLSIWHASSQYTHLPTARKNLMERESSTSKKIIYYIKTMLPQRSPDRNERALIDVRGNAVKNSKGRPWYIFDNNMNQLSSNDQIALAQWASEQGYDAVIWTGLGRTAGYETESKLKELLATDRNTQKNTIDYIENVHGGVEISPFQSRIELTPFEGFILDTYKV